jgi:activating signal cointegrator 1
MKIITIWQPWASLIALGFKKFETRSWGTHYRGKLAIHAARRKIRRHELAKISFDSIGCLDFSYLDSIDYPYGQIVAVSDLTSCRWMADEKRLREVLLRVRGKEFSRCSLDCLIQEAQQKHCAIWLPEISPLEKSVGDWQPGRYAWQLDQMQQVEPLDYKGAQGLRSLDIETSLLLAGLGTTEINL